MPSTGYDGPVNQSAYFSGIASLHRGRVGMPPMCKLDDAQVLHSCQPYLMAQPTAVFDGDSLLADTATRTLQWPWEQTLGLVTMQQQEPSLVDTGSRGQVVFSSRADIADRVIPSWHSGQPQQCSAQTSLLVKPPVGEPNHPVLLKFPSVNFSEVLLQQFEQDMVATASFQKKVPESEPTSNTSATNHCSPQVPYAEQSTPLTPAVPSPDAIDSHVAVTQTALSKQQVLQGHSPCAPERPLMPQQQQTLCNRQHSCSQSCSGAALQGTPADKHSTHLQQLEQQQQQQQQQQEETLPYEDDLVKCLAAAATPAEVFGAAGKFFSELERASSGTSSSGADAGLAAMLEAQLQQQLLRAGKQLPIHQDRNLAANPATVLQIALNQAASQPAGLPSHNNAVGTPAPAVAGVHLHRTAAGTPLKPVGKQQQKTESSGKDNKLTKQQLRQQRRQQLCSAAVARAAALVANACALKQDDSIVAQDTSPSLAQQQLPAAARTAVAALPQFNGGIVPQQPVQQDARQLHRRCQLQLMLLQQRRRQQVLDQQRQLYQAEQTADDQWHGQSQKHKRIAPPTAAEPQELKARKMPKLFRPYYKNAMMQQGVAATPLQEFMHQLHQQQ